MCLLMLASQTSTASVNSHTQTSPLQNGTTTSSSSFIVTIIIVVIILAVATITVIIVIVVVGFLFLLLRRKKKLKLESTTDQTCHNTMEMLPKTSHDVSYSNTDNNLDTNEGDGYYAEVEKKQKTFKNASVTDNLENDNIPFEENEQSPGVGQLYSVVDKSAAKKERHEVDLHGSSDISEMYSVVNKKSKKVRKESAPTEPQEKNALYAVVDKSEKKKRKSEEQNISQMYAVVNKSKKNSKS